jgi:hypothetical protein
LLQEQTELFDETQKVMTAWVKHRQEAVEAGLQTLLPIAAPLPFGAR